MFLMMETNKYFLFLSIPFIATLFYQLKIFDKKNSASCLAAFKTNNLTGAFIFLFIFLFTTL